MQNSFGITVRDLLKLDILKNSKVLAGSKGLNRRIVKVNIMEVPDIVDWVEENEFILTTAYSMRNDVSQLEELIYNLNNKGVSGIGIKTKRYIDEVPKSVLEIGSNLNFPIIDIPYEISFSEIITPALSEIINSQVVMLKRIEDFNSKLINVMLKGGGLKEIAETIHENIVNSICIRESIFRTNVLACNSINREEIEDLVTKNYVNEDRINTVNIDSNLNKMVIDEIGGRCINRLVVPIKSEGREYGSLYIWEDNREITPIEMNVIRSALPIIALELLKKLSVFQIESKHKVEFFDDLFSKDEKRQRTALENSYYFDFDKELSYSVIIIKIINIESTASKTPNNALFLRQLNENILSIVKMLSTDKKEKMLYGSKSDRVIILYGTDKNIENNLVKKNIVEFCNEFLYWAKSDHINDNISIGIGRNYNKNEELWKSYREANRACDNYNQFKETIPIHYDDLGLLRVLSHEEIQPELMKLYDEVLGSLVEYDREKGSELIETLKNYFIYGGNLKKVSENMYIHYNTIIYRISRIEEITGLDLDDYENRLNIQISLKVYDMLKMNKNE